MSTKVYYFSTRARLYNGVNGPQQDSVYRPADQLQVGEYILDSEGYCRGILQKEYHEGSFVRFVCAGRRPGDSLYRTSYRRVEQYVEFIPSRTNPVRVGDKIKGSGKVLEIRDDFADNDMLVVFKDGSYAVLPAGSRVWAKIRVTSLQRGDFVVGHGEVTGPPTYVSNSQGGGYRYLTRGGMSKPHEASERVQVEQLLSLRLQKGDFIKGFGNKEREVHLMCLLSYVKGKEFVVTAGGIRFAPTSACNNVLITFASDAFTPDAKITLTPTKIPVPVQEALAPADFEIIYTDGTRKNYSYQDAFMQGDLMPGNTINTGEKGVKVVEAVHYRTSRPGARNPDLAYDILLAGQQKISLVGTQFVTVAMAAGLIQPGDVVHRGNRFQDVREKFRCWASDRRTILTGFLLGNDKEATYLRDAQKVDIPVGRLKEGMLMYDDGVHYKVIAVERRDANIVPPAPAPAPAKEAKIQLGGRDHYGNERIKNVGDLEIKVEGPKKLVMMPGDTLNIAPSFVSGEVLFNMPAAQMGKTEALRQILDKQLIDKVLWHDRRIERLKMHLSANPIPKDHMRFTVGLFEPTDLDIRILGRVDAMLQAEDLAVGDIIQHRDVGRGLPETEWLEVTRVKYVIEDGHRRVKLGVRGHISRKNFDNKIVLPLSWWQVRDVSATRLRVRHSAVLVEGNINREYKDVLAWAMPSEHVSAIEYRWNHHDAMRAASWAMVERAEATRKAAAELAAAKAQKEREEQLQAAVKMLTDAGYVIVR